MTYNSDLSQTTKKITPIIIKKIGIEEPPEGSSYHTLGFENIKLKNDIFNMINKYCILEFINFI